MMTTLISIFEIMGIIVLGMMIGFDIIANTRARTSLVKVPARIIRRRR